jgi:hypothetical protein
MKKVRWIGLFAALLMVWASPASAKPKGSRGKKAQTTKNLPRKAAAKQARKPKTAKKAAPKTRKAAVRDVARVKQGTDGYAYVFRDDPLGGANNGVGAARIRVRRQGARQMLLRPRLDFLPELLKSVEDI